MSESQYITIAYVRQTGHILAAITRQSSEDQDIEKEQLVSSSLTVRPTVEEITLAETASATATSITVGTAGDLEAGDTIMIEGYEFTVGTINTVPPITIPISPEGPGGQTWPSGTTVNVKIKQPFTPLSFDIDADQLEVAVTKEVKPDITSVIDNPRMFTVENPDKKESKKVSSLSEDSKAIRVNTDDISDDDFIITPMPPNDSFGGSERSIWAFVSSVSEPENTYPLTAKKAPDDSSNNTFKMKFKDTLTNGDYRLLVCVQNRPVYARTFTI